MMVALRLAMALLSGLLFGAGLFISQMVNPDKVLAFLDVFGDWQPDLLLTMASAIGVAAIGYRFTMHKPLLDTRYFLPDRRGPDRALIVGALVFGIGWGLAGYCPGPAVTGLGMGNLEAVYFVAAMLAGQQLAAPVARSLA